MASPTIYPNGVGGTSGATLATASPLYTSGSVWYVSSASGVDAGSISGNDRIKPLATLAQAYTNASAGDTIVCLSGHAETLTAAQTFAKADLKLIGEGSGSNRPRFTRDGDVNMFDVTAAGFICVNIYFPASTSVSSKSRLRTAAVCTQVRDCYFECGASDTGVAFETTTGASQITVRDTTFASVSLLTSAQPQSAFQVGAALTDLELENVTFSGGVSGWVGQYAFHAAAVAITRLRAVNIDLLGDSDIGFLTTGTTGFITIRNTSGSARVVWKA